MRRPSPRPRRDRTPCRRTLPAPAALALGLLAAGGAAAPAAAQLLPETGSGTDITIRPGDIAAGLPLNAPQWNVVPALGVQQEWTNNAVQSGGQTKASFITTVTPSLAVSGDSSRITGALNYSPTLYYYSSVAGQNYVGQNLGANAHITLFPDQMFLDVNGFAGTQALNAGVAPAGTVALNRQQTVQSYSFSATPYVTHRFGGWGTLQVGGTLSETTQGALSGSIPGTGGSNNQNLTTVQEAASFTSGENFGRFLSSVQLLAIQGSGQGAYAGSYRNTATYQAGYAITHTITALASIGYENINYGGTDPIHIQDATWSAGVKLTPNPDSTITLLYGHQDGVTAAQVNASYAPTARTHIYVNYSEGVTTSLEQLQSTLSTAQFDSQGNAFNAVTGAPLQLVNNFFGTNGAVYTARNASVTGAWDLNQDALELTVNYQQQTPFGPQTTGAVQNSGVYGSIAWQRTITDALHSSLFFQYGVNDQGSGPTLVSSHLVVVSASLTYAFSDTLIGSLQYSYTNEPFVGSGSTSSQPVNLVVLGLQKTF